VDSKEKHSVKLSKKMTVALLAVFSILDSVSQTQKPPSAAGLETHTDPRSGLKFVRLPKRQYPELLPLSGPMTYIAFGLARHTFHSN